VAEKKKAETERDDALQKLRVGANSSDPSKKRELGSYLGTGEGQLVRSGEYRGSGVLVSSLSNWTAKCESLELEKKKAESERDDALRRLSAFGRAGVQESSMLIWTRHRCGLGDNWAPLVAHYRQLVEDVFVMEVCRATGSPLHCVKVIEFDSGGALVDLEVCHNLRPGDIDTLLQGHLFSVMSSLLRLACSSTSPSHSVSGGEVSLISQQLMEMNERLQKQLLSAQSELATYRRGQPKKSDGTKDENSLFKELMIFRNRRALANSIRGLEDSLEPSFGLREVVDPKSPVDPAVLRCEPVYSVTLDEYRDVLQQLRSLCSAGMEDEDGGTRLWNEHVLARVEEERRFTNKLSQLNPQFPQIRDDEV
ncbi:uncharacterized protein TM35_000123100, partial [Trypanosoma theileri]